MKKHFRKALSFLSIGVVSLSAFANVALASSYYAPYSFGTSVTGYVRNFNGNNIAFKTYAKSSFIHKFNKTYGITLFRKKLIGYDTIGSVVMDRDVTDYATWINVGPGDYYVKLYKPNDGVTLSDNNALFYNF